MSNAARIARGIGGTLKWALILGALVVVVIVIAVFFALGSAGEKSEQAARAAAARIDDVSLGMTKAEVRALLGDPEDTTSVEVGGVVQEECWYYGLLATERDSYRLCFEDGKLSSKTRY